MYTALTLKESLGVIQNNVLETKGFTTIRYNSLTIAPSVSEIPLS